MALTTLSPPVGMTDETAVIEDRFLGVATGFPPAHWEKFLRMSHPVAIIWALTLSDTVSFGYPKGKRAGANWGFLRGSGEGVLVF
ncbi:MAG: hypothetical protein CM15mP71_0490 [Candidatus Poseidoniales archaeon]|nr:MAG: hypothetical protein CM15mP71_0490 [Candidatus Poseidoniales archaeon]